MVSLLSMTLFALSSAADTASLDLRCYRLMAELAREEDPNIRSAGVTGAQYFLGRLDAAAPGFDADVDARGERAPLAGRETLIRRCGDAMGAGGRDFRALGDRLLQPSNSV